MNWPKLAALSVRFCPNTNCEELFSFDSAEAAFAAKDDTVDEFVEAALGEVEEDVTDGTVVSSLASVAKGMKLGCNRKWCKNFAIL